MNKERFTSEEDSVLHKYYPLKGAVYCSNKLKGRTPDKVVNRANKLGLTTSVERIIKRLDLKEEKRAKLISVVGSLMIKSVYTDSNYHRKLT